MTEDEAVEEYAGRAGVTAGLRGVVRKAADHQHAENATDAVDRDDTDTDMDKMFFSLPRGEGVDQRGGRQKPGRHAACT